MQRLPGPKGACPDRRIAVLRRGKMMHADRTGGGMTHSLACDRVSDNPAHAAPEWQSNLCARDAINGLPCPQGNRDAGIILGNPDIRVPDRTKREEGLSVQEKEQGENAEDGDRKEQGENAEDGDRKEKEDDSRNGNNGIPSKVTGQQREAKSVDPCAVLHAPGGTWLTKNEEDIEGPTDEDEDQSQMEEGETVALESEPTTSHGHFSSVSSSPQP
ncbi:hypothetical protein NDU88_004371 [Pleurodeles waltl]|uniref:Uncharacterized protein n=1 Tax=Pleurodeles waltl TaxID=8319 RepID=A0AAV7WRN5_PLEWA|nr:hypothetical protein NDU88_004371 [Pleurodeles waltl]